MKRLALMACVVAAFSAPAGAAEVGHCASDEVAIFNAALAGSGEIVSLCADSADAPTWLQYRMGNAGSVEMVFPEDRAGSLKKFTLRRYTRPQTTYLKLEFDDGGKNYAIFETFDAMEDPRESSSLRVRSLVDGHDISETDLVRTTEPLNIMRLEDHVTTGEFDE